MHKHLFDALTSLLTTTMRDAIRGRRLDPARVPFQVHVATRAVLGTIFLGVSFPTLHRRAGIRSAFWAAVALLPFGFRHLTSTESALDVHLVAASAEHVVAVEVRDVLRAILGAKRYGALTIEDEHLLLGAHVFEEQPNNRWTVVLSLRRGGTMAALHGERFTSEAAARSAVGKRCELLLEGATFAKAG